MNSRYRCALLALTGMVFTAILGASGCNTVLSDEPIRSQPGTELRLYIIRHAERDDGLNPPLNAEGVIRARALADRLEGENIVAIYCPDLTRNIQTGQDLADRLGIEITLLSNLEVTDTKAFANNFVTRIVTEHNSGAVLWIGNTGPFTSTQQGNLQELYYRLGGAGSTPTLYESLCEVIIRDDQDPEIIEGTYGGPSSLDG